jgi:hypothetical protein
MRKANSHKLTRFFSLFPETLDSKSNERTLGVTTKGKDLAWRSPGIQIMKEIL